MIALLSIQARAGVFAETAVVFNLNDLLSLMAKAA